MKFVLGIDPSLCGTGISWGPPENAHTYRHASAPAPLAPGRKQRTARQRVDRYRELARQCTERASAVAAEFPAVHPVWAFVEGYSYGSKGQAMLDIAEFGGILRDYLLYNRGWEVIEIPPSTLKKFCTGSGNGDKLAMALACQRLWGVSFKSPDEFDAYALCRLGNAVAGHEKPETAVAARIVEEVRAML